MKPLAKRKEPPRVRKIVRDPLKQTALLYLREALLEEKYEICAELIQIASEFGADLFEVQNLLEDPRRIPRL